MKILQKFKNSGYILKKTKPLIWKDVCIPPMFVEPLIVIAKIWKQAECPSVAESIKKMGHIYTHTQTCTHTIE